MTENDVLKLKRGSSNQNEQLSKRGKVRGQSKKRTIWMTISRNLTSCRDCKHFPSDRFSALELYNFDTLGCDSEVVNHRKISEGEPST